MSQQSVQQIRAWLSEQDIDALVVTQPQNRSYVSGWLNDDTEGAGMLLIGQQQQILLTNPLYAEVAEHEATGWQVLSIPGRYYAEHIATLAQEHGWKSIGFEAAATSYSDYQRLLEAGRGIYVLQPFEQTPIERLRQVKQDDEIALLKRAVAITDETFTHLCQWIQPGMTEKEIQWESVRKMVELGAQGPSFEAIVASGPNSSMPHAHASDRRIQRGEFITIDMGARYNGYCADMTRTICLGEPAEPRMREIYDAVLRAMKVCEQKLHAGLSGRAGDALARDVLEQAGLAHYFVHSTGHGVGLQIHEAPLLSAKAAEDVLLPAHTVVTVEPGVYIPGWGGVRIEDCVLLKDEGVEVLTRSHTDLVIQS